MKTIALSQGKVALVDDRDFEWLNQWKWHALKHGHTYYAVRNSRSDYRGKRTLIAMHREILGLTSDSIETDHANRNGLDNRRENLRKATRLENNRNQKGRKGSSCYKGVSWKTSSRGWVAQIQVEKKKIHLGSYKKEIEAARAYDRAAIKYFGEFAYLNFPREDYL